jgi:hypothetical protein
MNILQDQVALINSGHHTSANDAPLGKFADAVDECEPLFNFTLLGDDGDDANDLQTFIKTYFETNGKFKNNPDRVALIEQLFDELKKNSYADDRDKLEERKLKMIDIPPPSNITKLLDTYKDGPNVFFTHIFDMVLPPVNSFKVGAKIKTTTTTTTPEEGVIIKVYTTQHISAAFSSPEDSQILITAANNQKISVAKLKICDILINPTPPNNAQAAAAAAAAAEAANEAFSRTSLTPNVYDTACASYMGLLHGGTIIRKKIFKKDFRTIPRKTVRGIIEKPQPPIQCEKAFLYNNINNINNTYYNKKFNNGEDMRCYICFKNLRTCAQTKRNRRECEHIFPITESQLVWGTYLKSVFGNDGKGHLDTLKRLYAPVCNHCNIAPHKSNIPVLEWSGTDFKINEALITALSIECGGLPAINGVARAVCKNYGSTTDTDYAAAGIVGLPGHETYLREVFKPLVDAVNADIKFHLSGSIANNTSVIWDLFLCRYLFYFDETALKHIKILLVGGVDTVAVKRKLMESNKRFAAVITKIRNILNLIKDAMKRPTAVKNRNVSTRDRVIKTAHKAWLLFKRIATGEYKEKHKKNLKMWNYFKSQCVIHFAGTFGARNYESIYKWIMLNTDTTLNYLSHWAFTDDDVKKLNDIAIELGKMQNANLAGGGKKQKFIQSGGVKNRYTPFTNKYFFHGLIKDDYPQTNGVSFLLPLFLEFGEKIGEEMKKPAKAGDKMWPEEEEEFVIGDEDGDGSHFPTVSEMVTDFGEAVVDSLKIMEEEQTSFYSELLEDVSSFINKFECLENKRKGLSEQEARTVTVNVDPFFAAYDADRTQDQRPHPSPSFRKMRREKENR